MELELIFGRALKVIGSHTNVTKILFETRDETNIQRNLGHQPNNNKPKKKSKNENEDDIDITVSSNEEESSEEEEVGGGDLPNFVTPDHDSEPESSSERDEDEDEKDSKKSKHSSQDEVEVFLPDEDTQEKPPIVFAEDVMKDESEGNDNEKIDSDWSFADFDPDNPFECLRKKRKQEATETKKSSSPREEQKRKPSPVRFPKEAFIPKKDDNLNQEDPIDSKKDPKKKDKNHNAHGTEKKGKEKPSFQQQQHHQQQYSSQLPNDLFIPRVLTMTGTLVKNMTSPAVFFLIQAKKTKDKSGSEYEVVRVLDVFPPGTGAVSIAIMQKYVKTSFYYGNGSKEEWSTETKIFKSNHGLLKNSSTTDLIDRNTPKGSIITNCVLSNIYRNVFWTREEAQKLFNVLSLYDVSIDAAQNIPKEMLSPIKDTNEFLKRCVDSRARKCAWITSKDFSLTKEQKLCIEAGDIFSEYKRLESLFGFTYLMEPEEEEKKWVKGAADLLKTHPNVEVGVEGKTGRYYVRSKSVSDAQKICAKYLADRNVEVFIVETDNVILESESPRKATPFVRKMGHSAVIPEGSIFFLCDEQRKSFLKTRCVGVNFETMSTIKNIDKVPSVIAFDRSHFLKFVEFANIIDHLLELESNNKGRVERVVFFGSITCGDGASEFFKSVCLVEENYSLPGNYKVEYLDSTISLFGATIFPNINEFANAKITSSKMSVFLKDKKAFDQFKRDTISSNLDMVLYFGAGINQSCMRLSTSVIVFQHGDEKTAMEIKKFALSRSFSGEKLYVIGPETQIRNSQNVKKTKPPFVPFSDDIFNAILAKETESKMQILIEEIN